MARQDQAWQQNLGDLALWYPTLEVYAATSSAGNAYFHDSHIATPVGLDRVREILDRFEEKYRDTLRYHCGRRPDDPGQLRRSGASAQPGERDQNRVEDPDRPDDVGPPRPQCLLNSHAASRFPPPDTNFTRQTPEACQGNHLILTPLSITAGRDRPPRHPPPPSATWCASRMDVRRHGTG
jgi:hypothetical protein